VDGLDVTPGLLARADDVTEYARGLPLWVNFDRSTMSATCPLYPEATELLHYGKWRDGPQTGARRIGRHGNFLLERSSSGWLYREVCQFCYAC
jgi:hypothetical protein